MVGSGAVMSCAHNGSLQAVLCVSPCARSLSACSAEWITVIHARGSWQKWWL